MDYNTGVIRQLLMAAFSDGDLTTFCFDHYYLVYESFGTGMTKPQKVQLLLDHCQRQEQLTDLLQRVKKANPFQYSRFADRLTMTEEKNKPSPPPTRRKRRPRRHASPKRQNPFRYLMPVPPEEFVGRWSSVKEIAHDLKLDNGDSHACIGGRRFGKSSFLAALEHMLRQPEDKTGDHTVLPILIDFKRDFASEADFFAYLLHEVRRRVDTQVSLSTPNKSPVQVPLNATWLDGLLAGELPGLSLNNFEAALDYILDELYQAGGPTRLVILLDEVDTTLDQPWHKILFNQLRSLISAGDLADSVRLVLAGSRRFLDEVNDRGSPLWNVLQIHYLTTLDQTAIFELTARVEDLSEAARQAVWQQSGGHPFLAQYLLYYLWKTGFGQADETAVARLAHQFLHQGSHHLEGWCKAVEASGLMLYGHFANRSDWIDEIDLIRAVSDSNVPVKRGLIALCYHGFIVHDGYWQRYRHAGDLFQSWYLQEGQRLIEALSPKKQSADDPVLPYQVHHTIYDQRYQQVKYQYNAAGDINFEEVQNRREAVQELEKLLTELERAIETGIITSEAAIEADYKLKKAVQQTKGPAGEKKQLLAYLEEAKAVIDDITSAEDMTKALAKAIEMVQRVF